ncbi:translesion DNA synthesis-associated protein ImuA [Marinobacter sp. SS21]|uniref:translesion DNA synthesis-associated protein ImuA n=1 Tax=Marinobacter sp. SS21 TaxID=2979460 RepID=UPI00232E838F|nr:translesion DNA synthesis-associated protein ImuA [Marinobacter sp. SS21]MDC0663948.1 translesion DNA synthesis-associated protein ImuA [Marinobacter sp. SS21]
MSELLNTLIHDARVWQGHRQSLTQAPGEPTGYTALDQQLNQSGWPVGALSECLMDHDGIGELQLVLPLMRRVAQAKRTVFWINPPHIPYAPALLRHGVALEQVVVIRPGSTGDTLWTLENCLRSAVTGLVLAWPGRLASRDIRRLQLAAEAGHTTCVLFRSRRHACQNSPAALRLELEPAPRQGLRVNVLKRRGGWPGQSCQLEVASRAGLPSQDGPQVITGPWAGSHGQE